MSFPCVVKLKSPAEAARVIAAARADKDSIMHPSHAILRDGQIVGGVSLGVAPLLLVWHSTEQVRARDSLHLKAVYDAIMADRGTPRYYIACNQHSPFNAHMKQFDYKPIWTTEIFEGGTPYEP